MALTEESGLFINLFYVYVNFQKKLSDLVTTLNENMNPWTKFEVHKEYLYLKRYLQKTKK